MAFHFVSESKARDVYDSIKSLTCKLGRVEKLYAFSYRPQSPEKDVNGWDIYDARREWKRQGISEKTGDKRWRISNINTDYQVRVESGSIRYITSPSPNAYEDRSTHQRILRFLWCLQRSQTMY